MSEKKCDLTIAMIVKNEEKYLERCLKALQPLRDAIDCQLVITDTGSTDRTIEIAKKYADDYLEFEWCNDFAAARNTGVEVARGKWFFYIDADEIADESIIAIADFMKQKDRDVYDHATISQFEYTDEATVSDKYFHPKRMFNMTKGKRFFTGAVHEALPQGEASSSSSIDAWFHHYGYMASIMPEKGKRNQAILDQILLDNPLNLKAHRENMINQSNMFYRMELAEKAMQLIEDNKMVVKEKIFFQMDMCMYYPKIDRFQDFEIIFNSVDKIVALPRLEILYIAAKTYANQGYHEKSIAIFEEYLALFRALEKTPDTIYTSITAYQYNLKKYYNETSIHLAKHYLEIEMQDSAQKVLSQIDIQTSADLFLDTKMLAEYCLLSIKNGAKNLLKTLYAATKLRGDKKDLDTLFEVFDELYCYISKEEQIEFHQEFAGENDSFAALNQLRLQQYDFLVCDKNTIDILAKEPKIFDSLCYADAFFATLLSQTDPLHFYEKAPATYLKTCIEYLVFGREDVADTVYEKLKNQPDWYIHQGDLSKTARYGELYFYCFARQAVCNRDAQVLENEMLQKLNCFYEAYVKTMTIYVEKVYQKEVLTEGNFHTIQSMHSVAYIMKDAIGVKKQNPSAYISALKMVIQVAPELLMGMEQLAKLLEMELSEVNAEMDSLARQIKQMLQTLIQQGDKANAIEVFKKYKEIAPNDMELMQLQRAIEMM